MNISNLHRVVIYDPELGHFYWRDTGERILRLRFRIGQRLYSAHRLAWLYMTGSWPTSHIDHINGDRRDNRFCNLREATPAENAQNKSLYSNNTSGYPGVHWDRKAQLWRAQIRVQGRRIHLGRFPTPDEAYRAYLKGKAEYHTFQPAPRE